MLRCALCGCGLGNHPAPPLLPGSPQVVGCRYGQPGAAHPLPQHSGPSGAAAGHGALPGQQHLGHQLRHGEGWLAFARLMRVVCKALAPAPLQHALLFRLMLRFTVPIPLCSGTPTLKVMCTCASASCCKSSS